MSSFPPKTLATPFRDSCSGETWRAVIRTILDRHRLPAGDAAPFASGSDVVFGTSAHVVKLTAPRWQEEIETEARFLAHCEGGLPVATPEPVAAGEIEEWPYVVMTRIEGVPLGSIFEDLAPRERLALAGELGETAAALHHLPPIASSPWEPFLETCRKTLPARHREGVEAALLRSVQDLADRTPLSRRDTVPLHTELLGDHVLVHKTGGTPHLTGLIDFADGRMGHPFYEFGAPVEFLFAGRPECLGRFLEAYGLDPGNRRTVGRELAVWYLLHRFGFLARLLDRIEGPAPVDAEELVDRCFLPGL